MIAYQARACVVCQLAGLNMDPLALPRGLTKRHECLERGRNRMQWPVHHQYTTHQNTPNPCFNMVPNIVGVLGAKRVSNPGSVNEKR